MIKKIFAVFITVFVALLMISASSGASVSQKCDPPSGGCYCQGTVVFVYSTNSMDPCYICNKPRTPGTGDCSDLHATMLADCQRQARNWLISIGKAGYKSWFADNIVCAKEGSDRPN